jgi:hypothetical protein
MATRSPRKTIPTDRKSTRAKSTKAVVKTQSILAKVKFKKKGSTKLIAAAFTIAILGLVSIKFRYLLVPATINGKPIFIWTYLAELNKVAGREVLDQLVAKTLIAQEANAKRAGVKSQEIDQEIAKLEEELVARGGLDAFLASQGLTRDQLREDLEINLKIRKLLSKEATVSGEEVDSYYNDSKDLYKDVSEEEAKEQIKEDLKNQKIQQAFGLWLEEIREKADIKIYLPGFDELQIPNQ